MVSTFLSPAGGGRGELDKVFGVLASLFNASATLVSFLAEFLDDTAAQFSVSLLF